MIYGHWDDFSLVKFYNFQGGHLIKNQSGLKSQDEQIQGLLKTSAGTDDSTHPYYVLL